MAWAAAQGMTRWPWVFQATAMAMANMLTTSTTHCTNWVHVTACMPPKNEHNKMPPKAMMSHLGYRSIDSMLKNEPFDEMYAALRFSEGAEWLNEYNKAFQTIKPSDFETRDIAIIVMNHDKWVDLAAHYVEKKRHR